MSTLSRNILYNVAGQAVVLLIGFVAVRSMYRGLGGETLGIVFFTLMVGNMLVAAMDLGISTTIVRQVAGKWDRDSEEVVQLLRTAAFCYWASYGVLVSMLALSAGVIVSGWLNVVALDRSDAATGLTVLGSGVLLALPRSLHSSLFRGLQQMGVTNTLDVFGMMVQQGAIVIAIWTGGGLLAVSWSVFGAAAVWTLIYFVAAFRIVPARALLPGLHRSAFRNNRSYALRMTGVSVLAMIHTQFDKVVASVLIPLGPFGIYAFANSAITRAMLLTGAVAQAGFPSLSALSATGDRGAMFVQYRRLQQLITFGMAAVFAVVPFAVPPVFSWLFGPTEAMKMLMPSTLLALGFYMNSVLTIPHIVSLAVGKPEIALASNAWAVVVVLPITVLLVWRWGLLGCGASWVVYHVFAYAYAVPRICRECTGEEVSRWFADFGTFAVACIVIYATAWFAAAGVGGMSGTGMAVGYVMATVAYAVVGWNALSKDGRALMLSLAGRAA